MREMESEVEGLTREKSLIQAELYNIDSDIQGTYTHIPIWHSVIKFTVWIYAQQNESLNLR